MKTFWENLTETFEAAALAALIAVALLAGQSVRAQVESTTIKSAFTNASLVLTLNSTNGNWAGDGNTNRSIYIPQGRPVGLWVNMAAQGPSTSNVVFELEVTPDGTNWLSTNNYALRWTVAHNGANQVSSYTNFPSALLENLRQIRVKNIWHTAITNFYITNLVWCYRP
jgi:hypothetical protein